MDNFIFISVQPFDSFATIKIFKNKKLVHSFLLDEGLNLSEQIFKLCEAEKIYDIKIDYSFNFNLEEFTNEVLTYEKNKYNFNKIQIQGV